MISSHVYKIIFKFNQQDLMSTSPVVFVGDLNMIFSQPQPSGVCA